MIRVLIVDDEQLVRTGLRMILESSADIRVVAEAADGRQAVRTAATHRPDVVLMDVRMPGMDGLSTLTELRRTDQRAKIVMLTTFDLDDYVHTALRCGAVGFLLKDTTPGDLIAAVHAAAEGSAILSPRVTRKLIDAFATRAHPNAAEARRKLAALTERERDVVNAVARGLSNADIAKDLFMSEPTVKAHVSRSLTKLTLSNRVQLALLVRDAEPPS